MVNQEISKNLGDRPKVGTGIWIINDKHQALLFLWQGSHGAATWCPPGGHLEFKESFLENAIRETKEETDLDVKSVDVLAVTNDIFEAEEKHYVTIVMKAREWSGEAKIMEPNKCSEMKWFDLSALPSPLFVSNNNFFALNPPCLCGSGKKWLDCHGQK